MSTLSREQAEFHAHQIIYGDIYSIKDHVALLLAHDAAQRDLLRQREEELATWKEKARWKHTHDDSLELELRKQLAAMTAERDAYRRCLAAHEQQLANLRGTMNDLRQQRAAMHGPGAPTARWHALMAELDKRFPDPQPYASSDPAEARYLEAIDGLLAQLAASQARCKQYGTVCGEIMRIMQTYHEQEATDRGIGTPGGLEHMGDVWKLFHKWETRLTPERPPA